MTERNTEAWVRDLHGWGIDPKRHIITEPLIKLIYAALHQQDPSPGQRYSELRYEYLMLINC